jgi:hypothetical protein
MPGSDEDSNLKTICKHDFCENCINKLFNQDSFFCSICKKYLKDEPFTKLIN